MRRTLLMLALCSLTVPFLGPTAIAQQPVSRQGLPVAPEQAIAAFRKRLAMYIELRKAATKDLPDVKETGDPAKISGREKALGEAIAMARASAKPGDIFGADLSPYLSRVLAEDWNSRSEADRKALLEEVPRNLSLTINHPYPTTIPLVSVPGKLLALLPMLPEELEYRLVDRRLLLRDRDANLIVDMLSGVQPSRDR